jgi:Flp pilus assembly protein TadG
MKRMRFYRRGSSGQAIIELALVLPILLLILFGITEFGRAIMTTNVLNTAAREGARLAVVRPISDTLAVQNRVNQILGASNIQARQITVEYLATSRSIKVTVTSDFTILSRGVIRPFMGTIPLRGSTVMRYEG